MHGSMSLEGHLVGGAWWKIHQVLQVLDLSDLVVLISPHAAMPYWKFIFF